MEKAPRTTPRQRARAQTEADILRIARKQLAESGAAALSLRAIARELGLVSSAVYRYVSSRDELITKLLVQAYVDLADAVEARIELLGPDASAADQLLALAQAVREWGLGDPPRYALLFGTPVPAYQAPPEATMDPGTRVLRRIVSIVELAHGRVEVGAAMPELPAGLQGQLKAVSAASGSTLPARGVSAVLLLWTAIFGAVSFEVFGQFGVDVDWDRAKLFELHVRGLGASVGIS